MTTDYDTPRSGTDDENDESLEAVKAAAKKPQAPDVDEDEAAAAESFELPGADLSHESLEVRVTPKRTDEFVCANCFLVHHRSAASAPGSIICRDCAW